MPIVPTLQLHDLSQEAFDQLDSVVMRHSCAAQNKLGRLFDERVYENDLANRLRAEGYEVHTQVPIYVRHQSFEKIYYLDLVVNQMLYELKTVAALLPDHRNQALHYAMLNNIRRVKLLNFRPNMLDGKLLYSALKEAGRHQPIFDTSAFVPDSQLDDRLLIHLRDLVADWGTHLSSRLYNEALIHHFGGESECVQRVSVMDGDEELGSHLIQSHSPDQCFVVTAITRQTLQHRRHLQRQLSMLNLRRMQWINFNHSSIEVFTLTNLQ